MKKLVTILTLAGAVASGFAQGTVNFANNVAFQTAADRHVYFNDMSTTNNWVTGTNIVAQLFYGASAGSLTPLSTIPRTFRLTTTTIPGTWNGATRTFQGFNIGDIVTLQVRVWDSTKGTDIASSQAGGGFAGQSDTFTYLVPPAGSPSFAYFTENLRAFAITVPEPSAVALGVLGVAGLLLIRRRK